ncbi:MAG: lipopolysaccharide biosynthesis protein [Steroidobacteraceae bacterium]
MSDQQLRDRVFSSIRWTVAARALVQLTTWPMTIVVMRLLAPTDYGLVAMATIVTGFLALFNELGLGAAIVQARSMSRQTIEAISGAVLFLNLALLLALWLLAPLLAHVFEEPRVVLVTRMLGLQLLVAGWMVVPQALMERELRFREVSVAMMAGQFASLATTFAGAWSGWGVWALVAGNLANLVVRLSMTLYFHRGPVRPRWDLAEVKPFAGFGSNIVGARLLWYFSGQADSAIVGRVLGSALLGAYSVAGLIALMPVDKAMEALNKVSFPTFARMQDDMDRLRQTYLRLAKLVSLYAFAACGGIAAIATVFVPVVLSEKWSNAAPVLTLMAAIAPLRMLAFVHHTVVTSVGRPTLATRDLALTAVLVPLGVWVGSHWGLTGAAWGWIVTFPVCYLYSAWQVAFALAIPLRTILGTLAPPLVSAIAMFGACRLWADSAWAGALNGWLSLGAQVVLGGATFLGVMAIIARAYLLDSWEFVRSVARPGAQAPA